MNNATVNEVERTLKAILDAEEIRIEHQKPYGDNRWTYWKTRGNFLEAVKHAKLALEEIRKAVS